MKKIHKELEAMQSGMTRKVRSGLVSKQSNLLFVYLNKIGDSTKERERESFLLNPIPLILPCQYLTNWLTDVVSTRNLIDVTLAVEEAIFKLRNRRPCH